MPYIGTQIEAGNYRKLTNIASGFNGITTVFTLSVPPGTSQYYVTPTSTYQLLISVGGIIQQPDTDYTVSTNTITFTTAPTGGLSFFGILMGDALNIGTPSDGTVTTAKLASSAVSNDKLADSSVTQSKIGTNVLTPTVSQINGGPLAGTRNRIINGDMRIDQRNDGASVTLAAQGYVLDRWYQSMPSSSKYSVIRSTTAPAGFTNSLRIASLSSYTVQSNETFYLGQRIEGYNVSDLNWGTASAETVTLSFWVYSSLTGTFGGALTSYPNNNRAYPFTYAISSANTWTYVTVTAPGDTTGTWLTGNNLGISVTFSIGSGSSFSATAGSWATGQFTSATGATSILGTNGATLFITGVQLEPGTVATPFERRSYGQELALCQRYYESQEFGALYGFTISSDDQYRSWGAPFAVTKRIAPSISFSLGNITPSSPFTTTKGWVATQSSLGASTGYYVANVALSAEI